MKRTCILLAVAFLCCCSISAVEANEYLIGTYSQCRIDNEGDPGNAFSVLRQKLKEGGFNAVNFTVLEEHNFSTDKLGAALSSLHNGGNESVRSILTDFSWNTGPTNSKIGAYSLYGNYLQMEAEYQLKYVNGSFVPDVLPIADNTADDSYNSVFRHDTGELSDYNANSQNGYAWLCDEDDNHVAGMALSYPRFRWKPDDRLNPRTIGPDLKFRVRALVENKLYLTVALKFEDDVPNAPIADIKFDVLKYTNLNTHREWGDYSDSDYYEFPLISTNPSAYSTTIYNREYPTVDIDRYGNLLFEYYIELPPYSTDPTSLYMQLMGGYEFFYHLNPQVYWHGNGRLKIDYLTLQDEFQRSIDADRSTNVYWARLQSRLNQIDALDTNNNILFHYLMDEPFQCQFLMYNNIQEYMESQGKDVITATHLENPWLIKPNAHDNYRHYKLFLQQASPNTIALDSYPLQEFGSSSGALIKWNDEVNDQRFVQKMIQDITIDHYLKLAESINEDNSPHSETKLIYIPQIFGERVPGGSGTAYWRYLMPPLSMIKCLQLLPLCYGADGILSFAITSNPSTSFPGGYNRVAPLMTHSSLTTLSVDPQSSAFDYLTDANSKIATYGPIIRNLAWCSADSIMVDGIHPSLNLSEFLLDDLSIAQSSIGPYEGFVQCGYYKDSDVFPSFMLVNRRSIYKTTPSDHVVQMPVDNSFENATSQNVSFEPSTNSHIMFGTHVALYDPYDNEVHKSSSGIINVEIDAGDGKLLQMCSSLPSIVTSNADVKNIAYLSGSITIDQGAVVTIHPGTVTNIFAHSTILVKGGSTLIISGTVEIADSVSIIVEDGSYIVFNNATCNWGKNSILLVDDSGITATNTILKKTDDCDTWQGMRISNAGIVTMTNTTISGADYNKVTDSQVLLTDCRFTIPTYGTGLSIANTLPGQSIRLIATTDSIGFYGAGTGNMGLAYDNPYANLFLHGIVFEGLWLGLANGSNPALGDTIRYCQFNYNGTGMHLFELQYSPLIQNCTFLDNDLGAYFEVTSPNVVECDFINCDVGIRTELATASTGGIYDSNFSWGETGIESRGSNQRVAYNKFYTNTGILNHAGSILNMGNTAKNLFQAEHENLKFHDTASYNARVQLYAGHNDFYHTNPGPMNPSWDFHFDANWYVNPPPKSNAINASFNWFADNQVKISCPGVSSHYVSYSSLDPAPNVYLENNERMAQALSAELAGNYLTANDTYKTILNENEISESELLYDALDAYYRTADLAGVTLTGTESYLLAKIAQYETDNPILTKYLQDYLVKNCLQAEAYQTAIDLLELRILNAESPVDSLHAVMNLEIVLQLAALSENKKPISTKYTQYIYPDRNVFKVKHQEHWDLLDELLNGTEEDMIPIPNRALISSNYPNPFNPSTTIAFSIPEDGLVKLGIYNVKGQKVKDLCDSEMLRGHHKVVWDGKDKHQRDVSSGIYFVRLQASGAISTRKIMLMK